MHRVCGIVGNSQGAFVKRSYQPRSRHEIAAYKSGCQTRLYCRSLTTLIQIPTPGRWLSSILSHY